MSISRKDKVFCLKAIFTTILSISVTAHPAFSTATISEELYKHLKVGYDEVEKGAYDRAVHDFCSAVRTDRDSVTARRYLAYALVKMGTPELAMKQLSLVQKMTTPTAFDLYLYGEAYFTAGEYKQALDSFQKCLALVPDFDAARGGVIKSLALQGEFNQATNECITGMTKAKDAPAKKYYQDMLKRVREVALIPITPVTSTTSYAVPRQGGANNLDLNLE
jgi:tetratricopeptide (TPR) repeat protein